MVIDGYWWLLLIHNIFFGPPNFFVGGSPVKSSTQDEASGNSQRGAPVRSLLINPKKRVRYIYHKSNWSSLHRLSYKSTRKNPMKSPWIVSNGAPASTSGANWKFPRWYWSLCWCSESRPAEVVENAGRAEVMDTGKQEIQKKDAKGTHLVTDMNYLNLYWWWHIISAGIKITWNHLAALGPAEVWEPLSGYNFSRPLNALVIEPPKVRSQATQATQTSGFCWLITTMSKDLYDIYIKYHSCIVENYLSIYLSIHPSIHPSIQLI